MIVETKDVELLLVFVPVRANATECANAIVHDLGHNADLSVVDGHERALEKCPLGMRCWLAPRLGCRVEILNHRVSPSD